MGDVGDPSEPVWASPPPGIPTVPPVKTITEKSFRDNYDWWAEQFNTLSGPYEFYANWLQEQFNDGSLQYNKEGPITTFYRTVPEWKMKDGVDTNAMNIDVSQSLLDNFDSSEFQMGPNLNWTYTGSDPQKAALFNSIIEEKKNAYMELGSGGRKVPLSAEEQSKLREALAFTEDAGETLQKLREMAGIYGPPNPAADAAAAYAAGEKSKAAEAERQLDNYIRQAKAIYDLQDSERKFQMAATEANLKHNTMNQWGGEFGLGRQWNPNRAGPDLSMGLLETMPSTSPRQYNLDHLYGMGGPGGSNYSTIQMPDYGEPPRGFPGYAEGTGQMPESIDPDIEWMIGLPLFKGPLFEHKVRGFVDREAQPTQGMTPNG